jgi:hypothetical protein
MEPFRQQQGEPLEAGVRALSVAKDARTASARRKKHALEVVRTARARIAESLAAPEPTPIHGNRSSARVNQLTRQLRRAEIELEKELRQQ